VATWSIFRPNKSACCMNSLPQNQGTRRNFATARAAMGGYGWLVAVSNPKHNHKPLDTPST